MSQYCPERLSSHDRTNARFDFPIRCFNYLHDMLGGRYLLTKTFELQSTNDFQKHLTILALLASSLKVPDLAKKF